MPPPLLALQQASEALVAARHASSTSAKYSQHALYFARFLAGHGLGDFLLQPTQQVILWYIAFLSRTCKYKTIKNYLQGLRDYWMDALGTNPMEGWVRVDWALRGVRRLQGDAQGRKRPITPAMLLSFAQHMDFLSPLEVCTFTAMLIAFFGFFRKSNVTVSSPSQFDPSKHLRRGDVRVDLQLYCLWVQIRWSKTLQFGERVLEVPIMGRRGHPLDPVAWWERLCALTPGDATSPAFCYMDSTGSCRILTHAQLVSRTKALVEVMGLDPSTVSGHSYRRGGASFAALAGVPAELIKLQGDWRSHAYQLYIVLSDSQKVSTTGRMWHHIQHCFFGGELHC